MRRRKLPLFLTFFKGAINKEFVIKHYKYGVVKTKYPDMTKIIASAQQRNCRDMFKEAVVYAQQVMADPAKKAEWVKRVKIKYRVFNQIIKHFMLEVKRAKERRELSGARMIRKAINAESNHDIAVISDPNFGGGEHKSSQASIKIISYATRYCRNGSPG